MDRSSSSPSWNPTGAGAGDTAGPDRTRTGQDYPRSSYPSVVSDSDSDQDSVGGDISAHGRSSANSISGGGSVSFSGGAAYFGGDGWRRAADKRRSGNDGDTLSAGGVGEGGGELEWLERARARTAEVLQERKKMKRRLGLAAERFNTGSKGWLEYAQVRYFFLDPGNSPRGERICVFFPIGGGDVAALSPVQNCRALLLFGCFTYICNKTIRMMKRI